MATYTSAMQSQHTTAHEPQSRSETRFTQGVP